MEKIIPTIPSTLLQYRILDNILTPELSSKDYFYSASQKNFLFKSNTNDEIYYVNIDFPGAGNYTDNSYYNPNNKAFTTV
jgi:hypothetical protein